MNSTIEQWIDDLVAGVDDAQASEEFQEWLDVQSCFHDYSYRNTLLILTDSPPVDSRNVLFTDRLTKLSTWSGLSYGM